MGKQSTHGARLTIQVADVVLNEVDQLAKTSGMTRSECIREALRDWIEQRRRELAPA